MSLALTRKVRVGVLVSGRGSNMMSLIEAAAADDFPAEICLVISNRPDAYALTRASERGIATVALDHKTAPNRAAFDAEMLAHLTAHNIELVCLAGYMRLLSPAFVQHWQDRMLNIHPALLPSFKGLHTHERALEAGVCLHGATVHFVREELDDGPIVAQGAVLVRPDDTPDSLAARVLTEVEHRIYPQALKRVAGRLAGLESAAMSEIGPDAVWAAK